MACDIAVEALPGYLRVVVTGDNTPETLRAYTTAVPEACMQHNLWHVLVVVRLVGPEMPMMDVYKGVSTGSDETAHLNMRIAWVDENPERGADNMRLAENIAQSRGIAVKTFRDERLAAQWLVSNERAD